MDAVAGFTELLAGPDPPLDRAALTLAAAAARTPAEGARAVDRGLAELDRLASGVGSLDALLHRLFVQEAFRGNTGDYYDPRNSLLPHVLRRRLGIPITLAVVTIEVGRRAGVALEGVGTPGHFLVRPVGSREYLDVFAGGTVLGQAECEHRIRAAVGSVDARMFATTPTREILLRMLMNLRGVYRSQGSAPDLEWVLRMRLALPHAGLDERVELAGALGDQARWVDGARLLEQYAQGLPGEQAAQAERATATARGLRAHLN